MDLLNKLKETRLSLRNEIREELKQPPPGSGGALYYAMKVWGVDLWKNIVKIDEKTGNYIAHPRAEVPSKVKRLIDQLSKVQEEILDLETPTINKKNNSRKDECSLTVFIRKQKSLHKSFTECCQAIMRDPVFENDPWLLKKKEDLTTPDLTWKDIFDDWELKKDFRKKYDRVK